MRSSSSLEQRVAYLEIALRHARIMASLLVVVGLVVLAAGFGSRGGQVADEVRTHRLVVLDDSGHTRAVIGRVARSLSAIR